MMHYTDFPDRFWVTGTDTNIGKTLVSAILVKALGARYWKPIQTGTLTDSDSRTVKELASLAAGDVLPEAYAFREPLSPHAAAALEHAYINPSEITFPKAADRPLVIEAAGGLLVPLNNDVLQLDLIVQSRLPVVLVAANRLGTINHTLLSLQALYHRKVPVLGVILSGPPSSIHTAAIENFSSTRVMAQIPVLDPVSPETVSKAAAVLFSRV